jgi:hypothetical protein
MGARDCLPASAQAAVAGAPAGCQYASIAFFVIPRGASLCKGSGRRIAETAPPVLRLGDERTSAVASRPCRSQPSGLTPSARASRRSPAPAEWIRLLCMTLADGESFFLMRAEPGPGDDWISLYPYPAGRLDEMVDDADAEGELTTPRVVIIHPEMVAKIELPRRGRRGQAGALARLSFARRRRVDPRPAWTSRESRG